MKTSSISTVTHEWPVPINICHSQNEDFSGNIKTLVSISPFSFKCAMRQVCLVFHP